MGTFYAKCGIENPVERTRSVVIPKLLVDTGSEYTWVSERTLERIGIQREKKDLPGRKKLVAAGPLPAA